MSQHYPYGISSARLVSSLNRHIPSSTMQGTMPNQCQTKQYYAGNSYMSHRLYCSKGDGNSASEGKHVPVKDAVNGDKSEGIKEDIPVGRGFANEHARLGEQDQQEWLSGERFFIDSKKKESPFLSRRQRLKNEILRRVIPWEKSNLSLDNFPYYFNENTKSLLVECVASHLKHKNFTTSYGSRLASSGGRILLRSFPGTELYMERVIKAVARELQVPLLILDSSVLVPSVIEQDNIDFRKESLSEVDTNEDTEFETEDGNDTNNDEEHMSDNEERCIEIAALLGPEDLRRGLLGREAFKRGLQESLTREFGIEATFASRVSGEDESTSASESLETREPESKKPLKTGHRVKYMPKSVPDEAVQRIILGKIPTFDGSTNVYTYVSGRSLSSGAKGEVLEVNGDQAAVIFDLTEDKLEATSKSEDVKGQDETSSICWVDIQDLEHDTELQAERCYVAVQELCEILPSLEPAIVYFPDSSKWLSKAVPESKQKDFVEKLEEMLDQLTGPIVLICGHDKLTPEQIEDMDLPPQLGRLARLLSKHAEGLRETKSSKNDKIWKLFTNSFILPVPKEEERFRTFKKQIEEDKKIIVSRQNLIELHKVLEENRLSCLDLLHVKSMIWF